MIHKHYQLIKESYDLFYKDLLRQGKLPLKDTGVGYWGISAADEIFALFNKINLHHYNHFLDLGAGDFKVVLIASLFTKATGIEYDSWLVGNAHSIRSRLAHIPAVNKAVFIQGNFMEHSLEHYDIVFWHPDQKHFALDTKLKQELKGELIVHGPHFHPDGLKLKEVHAINGTPMVVYKP